MLGQMAEIGKLFHAVCIYVHLMIINSLHADLYNYVNASKILLSRVDNDMAIELTN